MNKALAFLKKDPVLWAAAAAALCSMALTPPDRAYLDYLNLRVLALLFCLMAVVAGLRRIGLLARLSDGLAARFPGPRAQAMSMVQLCFFTSAVITNDVALLTFVPFTLALPLARDRRLLLRTVVLETVAANLGSLGTPIGNPQNLFLCTHYGLAAGDFFRAVLPLWGLSWLLVTAGTLWLCRGAALPEAGTGERARPVDPPLPAARCAEYGALLALCLLTVFNVVDWRWCLGLTAAVLLLWDRPLFFGVDYGLLATFVCFFVFVGNLGRCGPVAAWLEGLLLGRELPVSALVSQVVSNVPAAAMLAPFTADARGLLLGTNIGGLGTPVASMASLISYKLYCAGERPEKGRYLLFFSLVNFALLMLLLLVIR